MKCTITAVAVGVSALLANHAFAGYDEMARRQPQDVSLSGVVVQDTSQCVSRGSALPPAEQGALMKSCLAEAGSPANVKATARQQKQAYCDKNAKNKALQGSERENYLAACMNHNEAQVKYEQVNRETAASDNGAVLIGINKALHQFTGFITAFSRMDPAGIQ